MTYDLGIFALEHFAGGVPAGAIFKTNIDNLRKIVVVPDINPMEVCLVGLIAYFEAFFKDHFASIVNIQPRLVENLKKGGYDTSVDVSDIVTLGNSSVIRLGSLLAENYDFGTAKRVNSIYQCLLLVTPFSNDEISTYNQLLSDRNLIVHNGGIYNLRYVKQKLGSENNMESAFFDSLIVTKDSFFAASSFCEGIVQKTIKSTKKSLENYIIENSIVLRKEKERALGFLDLWLEEEDEYDENN